MRWLKFYLIISSLLGHIAILTFWLKEPALVYEAKQKFERELIARGYIKAKPMSDSSMAAVQQEIKRIFKPWQPFENVNKISGIWLNEQPMTDIAEAMAQLKNGDVLKIGPGIYRQAMLVQADDVTIEGFGDVIFEKATVGNKGLFVVQGQRTTIKNITCRFVQVADGNGACVRLEGRDLVLDHVYFHSSQTGLLETASQGGTVTVLNSRFAQLGFKGQAHGIYLNSADLQFKHSQMLASKDAGHGIKSRGKITQIQNSILASLASDDSRLVDISNGGLLQITDSIMQEGPNSQNLQLIGFGLEQLQQDTNKVILERNLVIADHNGASHLLKTVNNQVETDITNNVFIGPLVQSAAANIVFEDRAEAGIVAAPALPFTKAICGTTQQPAPTCPLQPENSE